MKRWTQVVGLFISLYLAGWTSGAYMFNKESTYKLEDFEPRHRGNIQLPPCVKDLMACWEVTNPDVMCKFDDKRQVRMDTICMDLRFQCREYMGPQVFPSPRNDKELFDYCAAQTDMM